jgi:hypothetical protein
MWSRALDIRLRDWPYVQCPCLLMQNTSSKISVWCSCYKSIDFNKCIYIYIYIKLNQTVLELDLSAVNFCSSLDRIWTHTIDTLQHQSHSLMSSTLGHSTTSAYSGCGRGHWDHQQSRKYLPFRVPEITFSISWGSSFIVHVFTCLHFIQFYWFLYYFCFYPELDFTMSTD